MSQHSIKHIIEAALLTAGKPLTLLQLQTILSDDETPLDKQFVLAALDALADDLSGRGVELRQVASGYRLQVKQEFEPWVARLFEERPPRYSRALLETLALIAYRQPITRAEIEDVRGVSVSSNIVKTLLEREWIKVVGQRDVPGRPSMYGTTKTFLDYFNIKTVSELPPLDELMNLDDVDKQLDILDPAAAANLPDTSAEAVEQGADEPDGEPGAVAEAAPVADGDVPADSERADSSADGSTTEATGSPTEQVAEPGNGDPDEAPEENSANPKAAVVALPLAGEAVVPDTAIEPAVIGDGGDTTGDGANAAEDTADIDSLVHMLDQIDQPEPVADSVDGAADVPNSTSDAEPSALARHGDTAAAVEAARHALADQAEQVLDNIAERDDPAASDKGSHDTPDTDAALKLPPQTEPASAAEPHGNDAHDAPADTAVASAEQGGDTTSSDPDAVSVDRETPVPASLDNAPTDRSTPDDAHIAALIDADSRNHEAARGESVTPADSLRRSSTDNTD